MQTREYTDKDGNQRKATEVVLQKFRGELTLLDSRNAGRGGEESSYGGASSGGNFGRQSPMDRAPAERGGAGGSSGGRASSASTTTFRSEQQIARGEAAFSVRASAAPH